MKKWGNIAASVAAAGVLAAAALAGTVTSGLQPGQHMEQFNVTDVSGPAKGQTLCYV
jgi:hypothetical protein